MKMRAIVFDMDGVLFDTERIYFDAWELAGNELGIDTREIRWQCAGHIAADMKGIFEPYFGGKVSFEAFNERKRDCFLRLLRQNGLPLKPGLHEIMDFLKENGYRVALATSTSREGAVSNLTEAGILSCFDVLTTGDMFVHGKPDPEIYLTACRLLGSEPAQTYAVEDSYPGLESAHGAGMKAVMIPDLFPPTDRTRAIAVTLPSLLALRDALRDGKV